MVLVLLCGRLEPHICWKPEDLILLSPVVDRLRVQEVHEGFVLHPQDDCASASGSDLLNFVTEQRVGLRPLPRPGRPLTISVAPSTLGRLDRRHRSVTLQGSARVLRVEDVFHEG